MASRVEICNLALARIGVLQGIDSLDEDSQEARACALLYRPAVAELLRAGEWPWAKRRAALALVEEDPRDEWGYAYRAPAGLVTALAIPCGVRMPAAAIPFQLEGDDEGMLILTDQEAAELDFISDCWDEEGRFPADFVAALSWKLAADLAMPLAIKFDVMARCEAQAEEKRRQALANALNEAQRDPPDPSAYERERA